MAKSKRNQDYLRDRVLKHARLMLERGATVRSVAQKTGYSKTTVFLDLTQRLQEINYDLFLKVEEILEYNASVRHLRGGEVTRKKFKEGKREKVVI